jgi:hypothetical protein
MKVNWLSQKLMCSIALALSALGTAYADTFDVAGSVPNDVWPQNPEIQLTSGGPLVPLVLPVTVTGTIDISNGDVSNPLLQVSPYAGEAFSTFLSIQQFFPTNTLNGLNEWEIFIAGAQHPNLTLQVIFTTPLSETLSTFNGAALNGFAVLDSTCSECGFAYGGNTAIGSIGTNTVPEPAAVPGPIVGAGLPGVLAGFGVMLAWYRKRRVGFVGRASTCLTTPGSN